MQGSFTEKRDRQNRAKSNAAGRKRRNVQAGPQPRRSRRRRDHAVSRRGEAIGDGLDPGDGAGLEQDASDGGDLTGGQHEELGPEADEEDEEEDEEDDDHDEDEQASVDLDWEDIVQALEQHQRRTEPARAREAAANVPAAEPSRSQRIALTFRMLPNMRRQILLPFRRQKQWQEHRLLAKGRRSGKKFWLCPTGGRSATIPSPRPSRRTATLMNVGDSAVHVKRRDSVSQTQARVGHWDCWGLGCWSKEITMIEGRMYLDPQFI